MQASRISSKLKVKSLKLKHKNLKLKIKKTLNSQLSTLSYDHISGAEGIYEEPEIPKVCEKYVKRALTHSRGEPDEIIITIEKIRQKPKTISLLPVATLKCNSPEKARKIITQKLESLGISKKPLTMDSLFLIQKDNAGRIADTPAIRSTR